MPFASSDRKPKARLLSIALAALLLAALPAQPLSAATPRPGTALPGSEVIAQSEIRNLTNRDWLRGVGRKAPVFSLRPSAANREAFRAGVAVRLANGQTRRIDRVVVSLDQLAVYLQGPLLDQKAVGYPNRLEVLAESATSAAVLAGSLPLAPLENYRLLLASPISNLNDGRWLRGVGRKEPAISVADNSVNRSGFITGARVRLATGEQRLVQHVQRVGGRLHVFLAGAKLEPRRVGHPNSLSLIAPLQPATSGGQTGTTAAAAGTTRLPAFLARGDIRGIGISPPIDNWEAPAYGMNQARLINMAAAGFNTHRVWLNLPEFLNPPVSLEHTVSRWVAYIDRSVQAGFRAQVSMGANADQASAIVNDEATRTRFLRALTALCGALGASFSEQQVALEMLNEPPGPDRIPTYYSSAAPEWFRTCRTSAPRMTIILQPEGGWHNELHRFNLADYDWNTMFSFHPYSPGEFTHQGIGTQPHLYRVPMPITRYVGGKAQMLADVSARVNADTSLSASQKTAEIARYSKILDFLWWDGGRHWEDWSDLRQWIAETGIHPKRIIAGEFGVVSEHNYNGVAALPDVASRAHFMRKIRDQAEEHQLAGWAVHQAFGDFNLFEQKNHGWHLDTLIPELVTALFSRQPLPEGPPVEGR